jgi:hypothetical protein
LYSVKKQDGARQQMSKMCAMQKAALIKVDNSETNELNQARLKFTRAQGGKRPGNDFARSPGASFLRKLPAYPRSSPRTSGESPRARAAATLPEGINSRICERPLQKSDKTEYP